MNQNPFAGLIFSRVLTSSTAFKIADVPSPVKRLFLNDRLCTESSLGNVTRSAAAYASALSSPKPYLCQGKTKVKEML